MASILNSTMTSLRQRLTDRTRQRWRALTGLAGCYRAGFAYAGAPARR